MVSRAPSNQFETLPFIQQHVPILHPKLRELLIRHWHAEHVINVDSSIVDVLCSQIRALLAGGLSC
jgi:hypothetical protein